MINVNKMFYNVLSAHKHKYSVDEPMDIEIGMEMELDWKHGWIVKGK